MVTGASLPRRKNLSIQFFAAALGLDGEGPRLVYAEHLFGEEAALGLVGTHRLDREIGRVFFDDPSRMFRDLLGDAAERALAP